MSIPAIAAAAMLLLHLALTALRAAAHILGTVRDHFVILQGVIMIIGHLDVFQIKFI